MTLALSVDLDRRFLCFIEKAEKLPYVRLLLLA